MLQPLRAALCAASILALFACSQAQLDKVQTVAAKVSPGLQMVCNDAMALAPLAAMVPQGALIVPFVTAGCGAAEGLAKLAADPSSEQWVEQLIAQMKAALPAKA